MTLCYDCLLNYGLVHNRDHDLSILAFPVCNTALGKGSGPQIVWWINEKQWMNEWHLIMLDMQIHSLTMNNVHMLYPFFPCTRTCSNQPRPVVDPGLSSVSPGCFENKNEKECWLCLDCGTLYKFQKIDFSRPAWLGIKSRQIFIESGLRWLDFGP